MQSLQELNWTIKSPPTLQGHKWYLHSIHVTWSGGWEVETLVKLTTASTNCPAYKNKDTEIFEIPLSDAFIYFFEGKFLWLAELCCYQHFSLIWLALGEWHVHHSLSPDKANPLFNLFKNKQSFPPNSCNLIGTFGGLITKGRMSTCKTSIRSNSLTPGSQHSFFSFLKKRFIKTLSHEKVPDLQFPGIPNETVHTVLIATEGSKRSLSRLENYFVTVSLSSSERKQAAGK